MVDVSNSFEGVIAIVGVCVRMVGLEGFDGIIGIGWEVARRHEANEVMKNSRKGIIVVR